MITLQIGLVGVALVLVIASALSPRVPLWVAVLVLCLALLIH
jgi:hypothetical protein